jgi:hypothetical protein
METVKLYIHSFLDTYLITKTVRAGYKGTKLIGTAEGIVRSQGTTLAISNKPSVHDYVSDTKHTIYQLTNVEYNE